MENLCPKFNPEKPSSCFNPRTCVVSGNCELCMFFKNTCEGCEKNMLHNIKKSEKKCKT